LGSEPCHTAMKPRITMAAASVAMTTTIGGRFRNGA
jgi:hypothetical protein